MDKLEMEIKKRLKELMALESEITVFLRSAPNGILRIAHKKNYVQYYHKTEDSKPNGKYIRKADIQIAGLLAQKDYAEKMLCRIESEISELKNIMHEYEGNSIQNLFGELSKDRQLLVKSYFLTDQEYAVQWKSLHELPKLENVDEDAIYTDNGEIVKSKSEKILADLFLKNGIPYVYEWPLNLEGYGRVKPDFTLINVRTRKEYIWEHYGMLDNSEYSEKAVKKTETYERNNYFPGENLILSYETLNHPLNMKIVNSLIKKYLL